MAKATGHVSRLPRTTPRDVKQEHKAGWRRVTVVFYTREADWVDETTKNLKRAGNEKANRSLVVREGMMKLQEELKGKSAKETLDYFNDRQRERVAHP